ncbi:hypothetical protein [Erythrobacter sp. WG]|uniref:hypothetical protein n=1 Tax=Erythrobacter sp. WG TaxID=2985510 RepID=UPI002270A209|nr:hypothetical protein [Erythrobacter sp. WG]MCX9146507.1 hypothetical protein [Erythrobacter sp. WG]
MKRYAASFCAAISSAVMVMTPVAAVANTPGSVRDLIGARGSSGEDQLEFRGFHRISGHTDYDSKINYWWNGNTKECIKVVTYDGNFQSIDKTTNADCNQKGGSGDKAAAVAIGAVALLGIAALASKSHHRNGQDYDERGTAEFERGHRDGLYGQAYHNYSRTDAYSNGYDSGVRERAGQTSYRGGYNYGGGYSAYAEFNDLNGQERNYATGQLASRGFAQLDNKRTDQGRYMTYWRAASRQCLVVNSRNGYIYSIESVSARICRD